MKDIVDESIAVRRRAINMEIEEQERIQREKKESSYRIRAYLFAFLSALNPIFWQYVSSIDVEFIQMSWSPTGEAGPTFSPPLFVSALMFECLFLGCAYLNWEGQ